MMTRFKELLIAIKDKSMQEQETELALALDDWKKDTEQIDDILVIGIRV